MHVHVGTVNREDAMQGKEMKEMKERRNEGTKEMEMECGVNWLFVSK